MKKIISLNLEKQNETNYPMTASFKLRDLHENQTLATINYVDLSNKIKHHGLFYEGKLNANQTQSYFHWFYFDPKKISPYLEINEKTAFFAQHWDKRIPKGCLYRSEGEQSFKNHVVRLQYGKSEQELIDEAKASQNIVLMSDITNYPYNAGWFVIEQGKLLLNGTEKIVPGKYWFLVKEKHQTQLKPVILTIKENSQVAEDISQFEFAFSINPIVVNGKALTSLTAKIPGTQEILVHNWRGGIPHIFEESITPIHQFLDQKLTKSHYMIDSELEKLLKEDTKKNLNIKILPEKLQDTVFSMLPAFKNNIGDPQNLKPGQYFYNQNTQEFSTKLKRALYGHTIFAVTKQGKMIVFKLFNRANKDNGLYIEQLGTALQAVSQNLLQNQAVNDEIVFAGVGANGGDPRTFLGLGENPGYKNSPEDNKQVLLQEKLSKISRKPILIGFKLKK